MDTPRRITIVGITLVTLFATSVASPALLPATARVPSSLTAEPQERPLLGDILGSSGGLRAIFGTVGALQANPLLAPLLASVDLSAPGVHVLPTPAPDGGTLVAVALMPFALRGGTRQAGYRVGRWPMGALAARDTAYAAPAGFIPVTPANASTAVSQHFRLSDFLTHDQPSVWPKVLVLRPVLLDKLELISAALERRGLPATLRVMSGFRTPQYNARGVGARGGRARDSRHMYGDAADVFVDGDGNGAMDDLNGDGRVNVADARVLFAVAEGVEAQHPELVGGLSAYTATRSHGPFVHVDARGSRARW